VSRSGFYYQKKNSSIRIEKDEADLKIIREFFLKSREKAGIISLDMLLRRKNIVINHKKIARIKKEYNLTTKIRRKNPYKGMQLNAKEHSKIPNYLNRDFIQLSPDLVYSTDMTYVFYGRCQKAFLSATKDLGTNEIVSYNLMRSPTVNQFRNEFEKLLNRLDEEKRKKLLVHSDQGFQYTHPDFVEVLKLAGVKQSMSRRGVCLDNAPIESFFGHFKDLAEIKDCDTFEEVKEEVDRVMNYYNFERPQRALNKKPPAEYRGLLAVF
jgi:transposase InsO family protein